MDSLIRYSAPTKFDKAPQFTVCKVIDDAKNETIYIQIGDDPEYGNWMKIVDLLGKAFNPLLENQDFIKACFDVYTSNNPDTTRVLARIIDNLI